MRTKELLRIKGLSIVRRHPDEGLYRSASFSPSSRLNRIVGPIHTHMMAQESAFRENLIVIQAKQRYA
jgi:hypothetical protein